MLLKVIYITYIIFFHNKSIQLKGGDNWTVLATASWATSIFWISEARATTSFGLVKHGSYSDLVKTAAFHLKSTTSFYLNQQSFTNLLSICSSLILCSKVFIAEQYAEFLSLPSFRYFPCNKLDIYSFL